MGATLELRGLTAGYGRVVAVRDLTLTVPAGACLALLGANGAGKTTTLRAVSGLIPPLHGQILLDGRPIGGRPPWELVRAGVGHVPEGRGVFPTLSVAKNLQLARFARAGASGELSESTARLFPRLVERMDQRAGTMSGGEQQMLAVARVLEMQPEVLLLDELSLGLAPILVADLFDVVRAIRRAGTSVVMVEQFVSEALAIADLVAVMAKGRLVFVGEPSELQGEDAEELVSTYLGGATVG